MNLLQIQPLPCLNNIYQTYPLFLFIFTINHRPLPQYNSRLSTRIHREIPNSIRLILRLLPFSSVGLKIGFIIYKILHLWLSISFILNHWNGIWNIFGLYFSLNISRFLVFLLPLIHYYLLALASVYEFDIPQLYTFNLFFFSFSIIHSLLNFFGFLLWFGLWLGFRIYRSLIYLFYLSQTHI